jgi:Uncharacterized protein conserved in bacteria (DUF2188)
MSMKRPLKSGPRKREAPKSLSVTSSNGTWLVKGTGSSKPTSRHPSQAEAVATARRHLRESGGTVSVQGADGRLRSSFTLGRKAMAKLNEVEGISMPRALRRNAAVLGSLSPSREQRREQIKTLVTREPKSKR